MSALSKIRDAQRQLAEMTEDEIRRLEEERDDLRRQLRGANTENRLLLCQLNAEIETWKDRLGNRQRRIVELEALLYCDKP